jgi:hypothetical protein
LHVEGANDMLRLLELKRDFPAIKMVFVGASEGWRVAPQLAQAGVPVIASALNDLPATFEMLGATQSNIGRMKRCRGQGCDRHDQRPRFAPVALHHAICGQSGQPGKACRNATGLTWDEAFAAISSVPADIMGVGDSYGQPEVGQGRRCRGMGRRPAGTVQRAERMS